ncbi:MAG TPA: hypothetical protein VFX85_00680 [Solirubrobacterales bacterium]|nr:hypothetical protein [Solirubrobacterales bacterium]
MRVSLGKFACSGIEAHLGEDIPAGVRTALSHYARKLKAGRGPLAPPTFLGDLTPPGATTFDLAVDPETEAVLDREAKRQGTTLSQLAAHTVMVYLAELDFLGISPRSGVGAASRP